ncbi:MAG: DUF6812 domain-containing protein [Thermoleophilia bacterium]
MLTSDHPTQQHTERIKVSIETSSSTVIGIVHPPAIAYRSRLSDLLNQKGTIFVNVTEATVFTPKNATEPAYKTSYLAINLCCIETVRPLEEG